MLSPTLWETEFMTTETDVQTEMVQEEGYDRLEALLDKHCDMNLEMLDGFFAALLVGPEHRSVMDYLPVIWGESKPAELALPTKDEQQEFVQLIINHWNSTRELLESEAMFSPILKDDLETADAHDWASGFMKGISMHSSGWQKFLNDENHAGPMVPIFALHYQYSEDPSMQPFAKALEGEQKQNVIAAAAGAVMMIKQYFDKRRKKPVAETTYQRSQSKVGRNDPCPCGSGKKFKQCCGA